MAVKNRLKILIAERDAKQNELAEAVGVTKQTISSIVNNRYNTSLEVALNIAKYFNVKVDDIFYIDTKINN